MSEEDADDNAAPIETATISCDSSQVVDPKNSVAKGIADIILGSIKKPLINKIKKKIGHKIDNQLDLPKLVGDMILKSLDKEDPVDKANKFAVNLGLALNTYVVDDKKLLKDLSVPRQVNASGGTKQHINTHRTCRRRRKKKNANPTRRQTCHR